MRLPKRNEVVAILIIWKGVKEGLGSILISLWVNTSLLREDRSLALYEGNIALSHQLCLIYTLRWRVCRCVAYCGKTPNCNAQLEAWAL